MTDQPRRIPRTRPRPFGPHRNGTQKHGRRSNATGGTMMTLLMIVTERLLTLAQRVHAGIKVGRA